MIVPVSTLQEGRGKPEASKPINTNNDDNVWQSTYDETSYYYMREVTDKALQRLYQACRSNTGFPGDIPDESHGLPSTNEILNALGLTPPSLEDMGSTETLQESIPTSPLNAAIHSNLSKTQHPQLILPTQTSIAQDEHLSPPTHSPSHMESLAQSPSPRRTLAAAPPLRSATPPEMDMCEQFLSAVSESSSQGSDSGAVEEEYSYIGHLANSVFDLNIYLETSSFSIPTSGPHPACNVSSSRQIDGWAMVEHGHATRQVGTAVSEPGILYDGYLSHGLNISFNLHTTAVAH
jgi:hypothetical protein